MLIKFNLVVFYGSLTFLSHFSFFGVPFRATVFLFLCATIGVYYMNIRLIISFFLALCIGTLIFAAHTLSFLSVNYANTIFNIYEPIFHLFIVVILASSRKFCENFDTIFKIAMLISLINSIIVIMQGFQINYAYVLRNYLYLNSSIGASLTDRPSGLSMSSFHFVYHSLLGFSYAFYLFMKEKSTYVFFAFVIMSLGFIFSGSLPIWLFLFILLVRAIIAFIKIRHAHALLIIFFFGLSFLLFADHSMSLFEVRLGDLGERLMWRVVNLYYVAVLIAELPVGAPFGYFSQKFLEISGYEFIGAHFYLANVAITYGPLVSVMALLWHVIILQRIYFVRERYPKIAPALLLYWIMYLFFGLFHNGGFWEGEVSATYAVIATFCAIYCPRKYERA